MTEWITPNAAAKALGVSRPTIFYYVRTGKLQHRHTFTRNGMRTEITLAGMRTEKAEHGAIRDMKPVKCEECRK